MLLIPVALALPYAPFAGVFGFVPLPATLVAVIVGITLAYVAATELLKKWFYRGTWTVR
jgi:Mg2+-importing ATPase